MNTLLDLNDVELATLSDGYLHHSPGYVRYDGNRYNYGAGARAVARKYPRELSTRYWAQFNLQPLTPPLGPARHSADLIHGHLQQLLTHAQASLLIAAPGHLEREQLSLLLGVLGTLPGTVAALVHRSTAIAAASAAQDCVHVEVQLQQTLVTPVIRQGNQWEAGDSTRLPGQGWLNLLDQLASQVAGQFVDQTRFDPQRKADSEQLLFDAIPELLKQLSDQGEARLEIDGYSARILPEHLASVGERYRSELARANKHATLALLLSPMLAAIPGLADGNTVLEAEDWRQPLLDRIETLKQPAESLRLARSLEASGATPVSASPPAMTVERPTHCLIGHRVCAFDVGLSALAGVDLVTDAEQVMLTGSAAASVQINGSPAQAGQVLAAGDTLTAADGYHATLVVVED